MVGSPSNVLVTGASGFIGKRAVSGFIEQQFNVSTIARKQNGILQKTNCHLVNTIVDIANWDEYLEGVATIIHLAGRAHRRAEIQAEEIETYRSVNVTATLQAARSAARIGVQRFIYLSSIAVNGATTDGRGPFRPDELPCPVTPYGSTKLEAELGLEQVHAEYPSMAIDIIRCPVIIGPNPPGNLAILEAAIKRHVPLPLGSIFNRRTFLAIEDLVSFLILRSRASTRDLRRFNLCSEDTISTPDLVRHMAAAMAVTPLILPFPRSALRMILNSLNRTDKADALLSDLEIDTTEALKTGWRPEFCIPDAIRRSFSVHQ